MTHIHNSEEGIDLKYQVNTAILSTVVGIGLVAILASAVLSNRVSRVYRESCRNFLADTSSFCLKYRR